MLKHHDERLLAREKALAAAVRQVAAELRLIDVADLVAFIRLERYSSLQDLVNSSAELYFRPDSLRFGSGGDVDATWDSAPVVSLDMEFFHQDVSVFFRLHLDGLNGGVEIDYIAFDNPGSDPDGNTRLMVQALEGARKPADLATVA